MVDHQHDRRPLGKLPVGFVPRVLIEVGCDRFTLWVNRFGGGLTTFFGGTSASSSSTTAFGRSMRPGSADFFRGERLAIAPY